MVRADRPPKLPAAGRHAVRGEALHGTRGRYLDYHALAAQQSLA